jgi:hypothetical protein
MWPYFIVVLQRSNDWQQGRATHCPLAKQTLLKWQTGVHMTVNVSSFAAAAGCKKNKGDKNSDPSIST